jgi:hypothetical protein
MADEFDKYEIEDLVANAIGEKPDDFAAAFHSIMRDRLLTKVEDKKIEIAGNLFGDPLSTSDEETPGE